MGEDWCSHSYHRAENFAVAVPKKDGTSVACVHSKIKIYINLKIHYLFFFFFFSEKTAMKTVEIVVITNKALSFSMHIYLCMYIYRYIIH